MSEASRHDAWQAGDSYDQYMGRWSRRLAPRFLDWFGVGEGLDWLEVGCGTGALSAAIVARCRPNSLLSIDSSAEFLARARAAVPDPVVTFQEADARSLPVDDVSRDAVVSALVLNFVPDKEKALAEMKRVTRPGGRVGFYVWDYPGGGLGFLRAFWNAAVSLDPEAQDLAENKRFPFCTAEGVGDLARGAGLADVEVAAVEAPMVFQDFDDLWRPFTLGTGPAPGYCMSLTSDARAKLMETLRASLPIAADGAIPLTARAWAVKATVA